MAATEPPTREIPAREPGGRRNSRIPVRHLSSVLLRTPDLFWRVARAEAAKHVFARMDRRFLDGESRRLQQVSLKIVNTCNLRCKTCGQWGDTGYNHDRPGAELREIVPSGTYRRMVDQLAHLRPFYYIWGGEPYLYPDLMPLMEHMKERGGIVGVVTNGTLMAKTADRLVGAGVDMLMLSVDGIGPVHNEIRRSPGTTSGISRRSPSGASARESICSPITTPGSRTRRTGVATPRR